MTILGIDISHWSALAHKPVNITQQGYDFLFWKSTQGSTYRDPTFVNFMDTKYGNPLFAAFHYMDTSSAEGQFQNIKRAVPRNIPVIIDMEEGDIVTAQRLISMLRADGYSSPLFYLPEWYWVHIGRPNIAHFPPLWASVRVQGSGYGSELYHGVGIKNWHPYGGNTPALLQFTQKAKVDGCSSPLDVSAFLGDRAQLDRLLLEFGAPLSQPDYEYVVRPGDTLWEIAYIMYGDSNRWREIANANHLSNPNRLMPGERLRIPGWDGIYHSHTNDAIRYTVKPGDTLTSIAARHRVSVGALYAANRATIGNNPDRILVGMVLSIPKVQ